MIKIMFPNNPMMNRWCHGGALNPTSLHPADSLKHDSNASLLKSMLIQWLHFLVGFCWLSFCWSHVYFLMVNTFIRNIMDYGKEFSNNPLVRIATTTTIRKWRYWWPIFSSKLFEHPCFTAPRILNNKVSILKQKKAKMTSSSKRSLYCIQ